MNNFFFGIDAGTTYTKGVLINQQRSIISTAMRRTGANISHTASLVFNDSLRKHKITHQDVDFIIATGFGRKNISFANKTQTEITCHAHGTFFYFNESITIVDIGGQDNKIIKLDNTGNRIYFKMNRKCAAGTGVFLEEIANMLNVQIEEMNRFAEAATEDIELGSFCTVFTKTEILDRIRSGIRVENLVKGAYRSVVKRIMEMDELGGQVVLTGGVIAHHGILRKLFDEQLKKEVDVPPSPQYIGAFGAALLAYQSVLEIK